MEKNKTALQTLIEWGDKMMLEHPMKTLSFAEAIDKAVELLEMEKQQIVNSFTKGFGEGVVFGTVTTYKHQTAEQYYKENYEHNT